MHQQIAIRLSAKDTYLKGLVNLIKSRGAMLSRYCSFAIQYYVDNKDFVHIADVIPDKNEKIVYMNISVDKELLSQLEEDAKKIKLDRSKMIKNILLNSITKSDEEDLVDEEEFWKLILSSKKENTPIPVEIPKADIQEPPKEKHVEREVKTEEKPAVKKKAEVENVLLNNFFPSVMDQAADWD